jgi:dTDP-glucose 4,6-dehydratase
MNILIVGSTGFVGSNLIKSLDKKKHNITAFSRSAKSEDFSDGVKVFQGDLCEPDTLDGLCEDIDVAYYFIHSLTSKDFMQKDKRLARRFREIASEAGVDRVVYLSGISGSENNLSPHLKSRRDVEVVLFDGEYDTTVLRAAVIIGGQSASFRMIDDVTDRLPLMVVPKWVRTPSNPIWIGDVVEYLIKVLDYDETRNNVYDIGCKQKWSYKGLIEETANIKGKKVRILPVPVMTPELSSYWLKFTTDVQYSIAKPLIKGMKNPVTVDSDTDLNNLIDIDITPIDVSIEKTLDQ